MMRSALASILVLLAACESGGSSRFEVPPRGEVPPPTDPCGGFGKCTGGGAPAGPLDVENDSEIELKVGWIAMASATIDARIVEGSLAIELPADILPDFATTFVPPHGRTSFGQPIFVSDSVKGAFGPEVAAILQVGGVTALYVGKGSLRTRRVDGVLQLVPLDSTKIRILKISKDVTVCTGETTRIAFDPPASDLKHDFIIGNITRTDGCTTVQLTPSAATDTARQVRFCTPPDAWPFEPGDVVKIENAIFLSPIKEGLRLRRADNTAFELVRFERTPESVFVTGSIDVQANAACLLPKEPVPTCKIVNLGARPTSTNAVLLNGARAWVAGGTMPAFSIDCVPPRNPIIEIVARSAP